jgi:DNA invertase Pin-like site-specific DNA recombinase
MRVALYLRRSTNDKLQPESNDTQEDLLRAYCTTNGHIPVRVYADSASGRSVKKRIAFQSLIEEVRVGADFEAVVVRDVSRWGRFENADESAYWEFFCLKHGVRVLYVEESFGEDTNPYAVLMKSLKRLFASEFSREKSRMVRYTQTRVVKQGFRHGGPAPYGMRRVLVRLDGSYVQDLAHGEWKKLTTFRCKLAPGNPDEVAIVQRIFAMYVEEGLSRAEIVRRLNYAGVPSPKGAIWRSGIVASFLTRPEYMGSACYRNRQPLERRDRSAVGVFKNPDDIVLAPNAWAAIVSPETWTAANDRLRVKAWAHMDRDLPAQMKHALGPKA